jgi:hypothetical protein
MTTLRCVLRFLETGASALHCEEEDDGRLPEANDGDWNARVVSLHVARAIAADKLIVVEGLMTVIVRAGKGLGEWREQEVGQAIELLGK